MFDAAVVCVCVVTSVGGAVEREAARNNKHTLRRTNKVRTIHAQTVRNSLSLRNPDCKHEHDTDALADDTKMPFVPPTMSTKRNAIGAGIPRALHSVLDPYAFAPIPEPDEDDWLFDRGSAKGQTFDKYVRDWRPLRSNLKNTSRRKLYLQPIGTAKDVARFPNVDALATGVHAFFGLETIVLPMISLSELGTKAATSIRRRGQQRNAGDINTALKRLTPPDAFACAGVTMHDLYKGDFNYLFGLGGRADGVGFGVFSFHRHDPASPDCEFHHGATERRPGDDAVMLRRAFTTLTHELGHAFAFKHCVFFSCLMQGANSLEEAEGRWTDLCPVCLRKLLWVTMQESAEGARARYERLAHFFAQHPQSFPAHLEFILRRIAPELPPGEACKPCDDDHDDDQTGDLLKVVCAHMGRARGTDRGRARQRGQPPLVASATRAGRKRMSRVGPGADHELLEQDAFL